MKKTTISLLFITAIITLSYYYLDRQLVWFLAAHHSRDFTIPDLVSNGIGKSVAAFVFIFYIYFAIMLVKSKLSQTDKKLLFVCNSITISIFFKDVLKIAFGRYLTMDMGYNNPSLLGTHDYGFHWFTHFSDFASFPSGHAALIFSFSTSMWFFFPKLRWLWVSLAILVAAGALWMYCHFASDIFAGAMLGTVVAMLNYRYWLETAAFSSRDAEQ